MTFTCILVILERDSNLGGLLTALTNWPLPHRHKDAILKLLLYVKLIETMEIQELY